jgi:hypothetical protein
MLAIAHTVIAINLSQTFNIRSKLYQYGAVRHFFSAASELYVLILLTEKLKTPVIVFFDPPVDLTAFTSAVM